MKTINAMTFVYLFIFSVMVGGTLLLPTTRAATISADVDIDPDKINLTDDLSKGIPVVIAVIQFDKPDQDRIEDINETSILLDGVIPPTRGELTPKKYKAFFDKAAVIDYLWLLLYHMGYTEPFKNVEVELTVTGELTDGTPFEGSHTIFVSAK